MAYAVLVTVPVSNSESPACRDPMLTESHSTNLTWHYPLWVSHLSRFSEFTGLLMRGCVADRVSAPWCLLIERFILSIPSVDLWLGFTGSVWFRYPGCPSCSLVIYSVSFFFTQILKPKLVMLLAKLVYHHVTVHRHLSPTP